MKVQVRPDLTTGLADARRSDGSLVRDDNPAAYSELVTVFVSGLDASASLQVQIGDNEAEIVSATSVAGTEGGVTALAVRVPNVCCGGLLPVNLSNAGVRTVNAAPILVR